MESVCDFVRNWFDAHGDASHDFDEIPEESRLHPDRKVCGILKCSQMLQDPSRMWLNMWAEHDVLGLCGTTELHGNITEDDLLYLHRCGVSFDSDVDGLFFFI